MLKGVINTFRTSKVEDRTFRYLKLPNSLRCLLVSDQDVEKSAACLHVGIGSLYDPVHAQGLAHFLEHMLFLGTKKYPQENYYSEFIQKNGGQKNAATGEDYTYYYFDIKNECFKEAVDIFSQFFKEPLFTDTATSREMNAVDNEYKKNLSEDGRRMYQFIKSIVVKPGSPLNTFQTGSLETLDIPTIREDLLNFHGAYYSAHLMNLVMVSKLHIDELEQMAIQNFSEVAEKQVELKNFLQTPTFDQTNLGHIYKLVPYKNLKRLNVYWVLPYSEHRWRAKSNQYLSHVIGHEGPNSLLSYLIQEGLALGLSAGPSHRMSAIDIFSVTVTLTDAGEKNYLQVLKILHGYLNKIRSEGVQGYIYDELKLKAQIDFDYMTKRKAMMLANGMSGRILKTAEEHMADILWKPYSYEEFDEADIKERLNLLTLQNSFVIFQSKLEEKEGMLQERWYGSKYAVEKMSDSLIQELNTILPENLSSKNQSESGAKLGHPPVNNYMPKDLKEMKLERPENSKPALPQLISQNPKVFFKQDDSFPQPSIFGKMKLVVGDCNFPYSAMSQVFVGLWKELLSEYLRESLYMAQMAGISATVETTLEYVGASFYGYNDRMDVFIREFLEKVQHFQVAEDLFDDRKEAKIRAFQNQLKQEPYQLLNLQVQNILVRSSFSVHDLLKALQEELTYSAFLQEQKKWLKNMQIEYLIMGHLTEQQALKIVSDAQSSLTYSLLPLGQESEIRVSEIPDRHVFEFNRLNEEAANPNSAVLAQFQCGVKSFELVALNRVMWQLLREKAFNQLRTQEQLGYLVSSDGFVLKKTVNGRIMVQSSTRGPDYLVHRINEFLLQMKNETIAALTQEKVDEAKNAIISNLMQKDLTLAQEGLAYWDELTCLEYEFGRREISIDYYRQVTKEDVVAHFERVFFQNPKRLNVKFYSHKHRENAGENSESQEKNLQFYREACGATFEEIDNPKVYQMKLSQYPRL